MQNNSTAPMSFLRPICRRIREMKSKDMKSRANLYANLALLSEDLVSSIQEEVDHAVIDGIKKYKRKQMQEDNHEEQGAAPKSQRYTYTC